MEQQRKNNQQEQQEVDLVPVFVWIGDGIKGFFRAIGLFFKAIGHGILLFFAFLQANIILIGVFVLIGLGLGFYLDSNVKSNYTAQLRVAPNFKSSAQLISNINYYNSLAYEQDFQRLSAELNLTVEEAALLKSFDIEPSYNDTELLLEYDELARSADTMALNNLTFEGFKAAKREMDYEFYEIIAKAKGRAVLEKIIPTLLNVKENAGIKSARLAKVENVEFNIQSKKYQLQELDTLIVAYQKMISNNSPGGATTNLYLGDQKSVDQISNLFDQKQSLLDDLETLRDDKYGLENTVNMVSEYVVQGTVKKQHIKLKLLMAFLVIGIIIAATPSTWRFLKSYPKTTK